VTNGDSITMSGSLKDEEHARALRSKIPGEFIWFEHDEKSYIIRDQATIDRAKKLWEGNPDLARKKEELQRQKEALQEKKEALQRNKEEIRVKIPDLSAQMQRIEAE